MVFLLFAIPAQVVIGKCISKLNTEVTLRNEMGIAAGEAVFGIELFLWDSIMMPFGMAILGLCSPSFVVTCSALKTRA